MNLKEKINNNFALSIIGIAIAFSTNGWFAHIYFQEAAKLVVVEKAELNKLQIYSKLGKEEVVEQNILLEQKVQQLETKLINNTSSNEEKYIDYVEIKNIKLKPQTPSTLKVGENIEVTFDYSIKNGIFANIWAIGENIPNSYSPSRLHTGKGTIKRFISTDVNGKLRGIEIVAKSPSGQLYKSVSVPVYFEFKND